VRVFEVGLEKLLGWLARGNVDSGETPRKKWLRRLLDANIWGPPTEEEEKRAGKF
jgi:hypothetical protein